MSDSATGEKARQKPLGSPTSSAPTAPNLAHTLSPSLLGLRVIFGRSLGQILFHQVPRGREAGRLSPQPPNCTLAPGPVHPRVSPQLLRVSLLHLCPLFHELHISVQQVQPPLRVPLYHLKLILTGGWEGGGGPGQDPAARYQGASRL